MYHRLILYSPGPPRCSQSVLGHDILSDYNNLHKVVQLINNSLPLRYVRSLISGSGLEYTGLDITAHGFITDRSPWLLDLSLVTVVILWWLWCYRGDQMRRITLTDQRDLFRIHNNTLIRSMVTSIVSLTTPWLPWQPSVPAFTGNPE